MLPDIAKEWDYEKNEILPDQVMCKSHKRVWWKCDEGHSYIRIISDRTAGFGCPYCSEKKPVKGINDFATLRPEIAKEWNYKKNRNLRPEDFLLYSNKSVWWICELNHEWRATLSNRSKGKGCPKCQKIRV